MPSGPRSRARPYLPLEPPVTATKPKILLLSLAVTIALAACDRDAAPADAAAPAADADTALTLDELACACNVEPSWVVRHVEAGVLGDVTVEVTEWRFRSNDLARARRLLHLERDFDANEELAALVLDLADEIRRLRGRLHALGLKS